MPLAPLAPLGPVVTLWLIVATSPLWLRNIYTQVLGCLSIGITLLFFNFPDIPDYIEHYETLAKSNALDFDIVRRHWNFEYGYDLLVFVASHFISFDIFYVLIITFTLLSYQLFFSAYDNDISDISFIIFTAIFIYYISFTLRTTLASALLAYSLVLTKKNSQFIAATLLLLAALMHLVVTPFFIMFPLAKYKIKLFKSLALTNTLLIMCALFTMLVVPFLLTNVSQFGFISFKLSSYAEFTDYKWNLLILAWIIIGILLAIMKSTRTIDNLWIYFIFSCVFILLSFNSFFQGRATWAAAFVFAYLISAIIPKYLVAKELKPIFCIILSAFTLTLLRFNISN